jgi:hypothetical protein
VPRYVHIRLCRRGSIPTAGAALVRQAVIALGDLRVDNVAIRPGHPFLSLAQLRRRRENGPEIPAFRAFGFVSRPQRANRQSAMPAVNSIRTFEAVL